MGKSKKGFGLLNTIQAKDDKELAYKDYYNNWKNFNKEGKVTFTTIYNTFKESHLKEIEGGPLKLYLYFCIHANNSCGDSWHSIQTIADFFETQTRTIDNWIKVLVKRDLIYREQKGNKSHTTYLIPYNNTLIQHASSINTEEDSQSVLDEALQKIDGRKFLYGTVTKVFHLFQWKDQNKRDDLKNNQLLFIISERDNGILIGHIIQLNKSIKLGVSELNIEHSTFESPFQFNNSNVTGIALSNNTSLVSKSDTPHMLDLLKHLNSINDMQLGEFSKVEYGKIDELFVDGIIYEQTEDESQDGDIE